MAVDDFQARDASLPCWSGRMMSESAWEVTERRKLGPIELCARACVCGDFAREL